MRIKQCICSLAQFKDRIYKKYSLEQFKDANKPAVLFGVFHQYSINAILKQNAPMVAVWCGTDAYNVANRPDILDYRGIFKKKNVYHIAVSKWISEDLSKLGVPHISLPVDVASIPQDIFKPVKLGPKIFTYSLSRRPILYGNEVINKVKKRLPEMEFINSLDLCFPKEEMPKLYSECFIGLRPTVHDGSSNMVVELGLMGRRCIHNGNSPSSIPWYDVDNIVESIKQESKKIGSINTELSNKVAQWLDISDDWLDTEFYQ